MRPLFWNPGSATVSPKYYTLYLQSVLFLNLWRVMGKKQRLDTKVSFRKKTLLKVKKKLYNNKKNPKKDRHRLDSNPRKYSP